MKVKIKRIDKSIILPVYETKDSVGFDLMVRKKADIQPKTLAVIPANIIVEVPKGYALFVCSRSSTPIKKGLLPPHGIGIIDQDYCGEKDEIKILVYNYTDKKVTLRKGEKIAQGIFVKISKGKWHEVSSIKRQTRGGFGSTG